MALTNHKIKQGLSILKGGAEVQFLTGDGSPLGVIAAGIGSIYSDYTGGLFYKKTTGTDSSGWEEISGSSALSLLTWKSPVLAASIAANEVADLNSYTGTIDGQTLVSGGRYLLKDQATNPAQNGIYTWAANKFTRATDADSLTPDSEVLAGMAVIATKGTQAKTMFVLTSPGPITVGTTPLTFSTLGLYSASGGVKLTGNIFSADLDAAGAIGLNGSSLKVNYGDGLTVNGSNNLVAVANAAGGLTVAAAGIRANVDAVNGSTAIVANSIVVPGLAKKTVVLTAGPDLLDGVAANSVTAVEWLVSFKSGTAGTYVVKVTAATNGTLVDFEEVSVLTAGVIVEPVISVAIVGGNLELSATGTENNVAYVTRTSNSAA